METTLKFLKISQSQKLLLSVFSFAVPILMLLYFTVSGINDDINFGRVEILGNRLLSPLTQLLVLVSKEQRLVTNIPPKNNYNSNDLSVTSNLIEENLKNLEKETQVLGEKLKITPSSLKAAGNPELLPATITENWKSLQNSQNSLTKEQLSQQYSDLTKRIRELINRVGDTSNLILDPALDSYYLMDVVLAGLPQAQQRVGKILLYTQELSLYKQLTYEQKVKLEIYASSLQNTDLVRIQQGISNSLLAENEFYRRLPSLQNLPPVLKYYETAVNKFTESLIQVARTGRIELLGASFFQQGEDVVIQGSQLWTVTRKELDKLLEKRSKYYENLRLIYLLSSLVPLATSCFFLFAIFQQINLNSLLKQTQESGIQVSISATELLATAKKQEVVVTQQTELMLEVIKSAQEISQLIDKLVQEMDKVASQSTKTAKFASDSQLDVIQMKEVMQEMENASKNISVKLKTIDQRAGNVALVLSTITKVAEQTNFLSLNAAIEAEKAGEYGRGFAIIAREIRRLADQTAVSSIDIEQIVQEMQLAVSEGVTEMNSFMAKLFQGVDNINKISTQTGKIIEQVQTLSPEFQKVNVSMKNQSQNAQIISESMSSFALGMKQIKNSLDQTFFAIEQLSEAAIGLRNQVSKFKVND